MTWKNIFLKTAFIVSTFCAGGWVNAQSAVTISLDMKHPGAVISPDFEGLSFEITQLLPDDDGAHYFRPDNQPLVTLFHTLGIKSLRVGGNTSDRSAKKLPDKADLDSLFAFAKAADVKVIYCLRLHDGNARQDTKVAKYIMDHYADQLDCFSIGQEPNVYPRVTNSDGISARPTYAEYAYKWKQFEDIIAAAVPDVPLCGPSSEGNALWPRQFEADFGHGNHVALITAHLYPGRSGDKVPTPGIGRDNMLSHDFTTVYQRYYDGFAAATLADGLPYRLEEVNNFFNGGAKDVSDTFASALWGLDFMYWWAEHGATGLNFHTVDKVAAGADLRPSKYTAYFTTDNGFQVRPLGYGIKAFDIGGHGRFLPATVSNPESLNLTAYAVLGNDGSVYVTIINKEHGQQAKDADVSLAADAAFSNAQVMSLIVPGGDVAAKTGMTLGGAEIGNDGSWDGKWTALGPVKAGVLTVKVPQASACIVRLTAMD